MIARERFSKPGLSGLVWFFPRKGEPSSTPFTTLPRWTLFWREPKHSTPKVKSYTRPYSTLYSRAAFYAHSSSDIYRCAVVPSSTTNDRIDTNRESSIHAKKQHTRPPKEGVVQHRPPKEVLRENKVIKSTQHLMVAASDYHTFLLLTKRSNSSQLRHGALLHRAHRRPCNQIQYLPVTFFISNNNSRAVECRPDWYRLQGHNEIYSYKQWLRIPSIDNALL